MCSQADDPSQHVSDDPLRAALDGVLRERDDPSVSVRRYAAGVSAFMARYGDALRARLAASATDEPQRDTLRAALDVERLAQALADINIWEASATAETTDTLARDLAREYAALAASATDEPTHPHQRHGPYGSFICYDCDPPCSIEPAFSQHEYAVDYCETHDRPASYCLAASATEHVHTAACHSENCLGRDHD